MTDSPLPLSQCRHNPECDHWFSMTATPTPLSEAEIEILREDRVGVWTMRLIATIDALRADPTAVQENKRTVFVGTNAKLCTDLAERLEKAEAALRRIAAGTFKPDEVARAALVSKEADRDGSGRS